MVAMARALIADPDAVIKAKNGRPETIRPCVRCNTCIDLAHRSLLPVHCAVNPLAGREFEFIVAPAPKRRKKVVVIGGGPVGMEAARRAAQRGHQVILFEKEPHLGGALTMASAAPFKADMKAFLEWSVRTTLKTNGLETRLATEATAESIRAVNPDAIVIAIGSAPIIPEMPGINRTNVLWAGDVDLGRAETGDSVLIRRSRPDRFGDRSPSRSTGEKSYPHRQAAFEPN